MEKFKVCWSDGRISTETAKDRNELMNKINFWGFTDKDENLVKPLTITNIVK